MCIERVLSVKKKSAQNRHQGAGKQVRRKHGEDNGERHRREQVFGWAGEKDDRYKHDANRQSRHEGRRSNFGSPNQDGVVKWLFSQVAMDILNRYRCVVDQNTYGQG